MHSLEYLTQGRHLKSSKGAVGGENCRKFFNIEHEEIIGEVNHASKLVYQKPSDLKTAY